MKKSLIVSLLLSCLGCLSVPAFADTLQLVSTSGGSVNGVDIYPYNFSVNGSTTLASLMCLNYNREINFGETWDVTENSIPLDNSTTSQDYRALALIDYALATGYHGYSASDLQFADWAIFDPAVTGNTGYTATAAQIENGALLLAGNSSLTNSGFYKNFTLYTPTSNQAGWTSGIPQEFIGNTAPSPVPEPSTLVLCGSGLMGLAAAVRRKIARV